MHNTRIHAATICASLPPADRADCEALLEVYRCDGLKPDLARSNDRQLLRGFHDGSKAQCFCKRSRIYECNDLFNTCTGTNDYQRQHQKVKTTQPTHRMPCTPLLSRSLPAGLLLDKTAASGKKVHKGCCIKRQTLFAF